MSSAPWQTLLRPAQTATQSGVDVWASRVKWENGRINSAAAHSTTRSVGGPSFQSALQATLQQAGANEQSARKVSSTVWAAWKSWADGLMVPGLPWYPSFSNWPGPYAPPTPNVPSLVLMTVSHGIGPIRRLEKDLESELGEQTMKESGAKAFVRDYANWMNLSFTVWSGTARWVNVMGEGPVPTYKPPAVNAGPVVAGKFSGGSIQGKF